MLPGFARSSEKRLAPSSWRNAVNWPIDEKGYWQRHACTLVGWHRAAAVVKLAARITPNSERVCGNCHRDADGSAIDACTCCWNARVGGELEATLSHLQGRAADGSQTRRA